MAEIGFFERLCAAKCLVCMNPENMDDEVIEIEYVLGFGDDKGEKLYFQRKEEAPSDV